MPQQEVNNALQPLLNRIMPLYSSGKLDKSQEDFWAARAAETFGKEQGTRNEEQGTGNEEQGARNEGQGTGNDEMEAIDEIFLFISLICCI